MDTMLDYFFLIAHSALVIWNLTGWTWQRTRRLHLATIVITISSWIVLGAFYGWGYCPCTDWHWEIKERLGQTDLPNSYIKYYLDLSTGSSWDPFLVDVITASCGGVVLLLSFWFNWRDQIVRQNDA